MLKTASIQHVALCHIFPHCETSLSVFRTKEIDFTQKPGKNPGKSGKNRSKTGQIFGTLSRDRYEQLLLMDFFDYLKKTFPADSGRTGSPRANLRPFLKSPLNVEPFY